MKKIISILFIGISINSFAYTIGDTYINNVNNSDTSRQEVTLSGTNDYIYSKYSKESDIIITTNSNNKIVGLEYSGNKQMNLKDSLGKYYPEYYSAWKKRPNQFSHQSAVINTQNISVSTFALGGKIFKSSIYLNESK